jgi:WD40-like Beta Propeller Repeat
MRSFAQGRSATHARTGRRSSRGIWCFGVGLVVAAGCGAKAPPEHRFYDEHIQPIFNSFCVGNTSPCHKIDPATHSTALGNLDLSSFEGVQKRRDVLRTYGSYPQPLLLLKAMPEAAAPIPYQGRTPSLVNEIKHAGTKSIAANSDAFYTLKRWLDNGANRDGIAPEPAPNTTGTGSCNAAIPAGVNLTVDTSSPAYQKFVDEVQPLLLSTCAFGTCHSSPQADLYLTCGDSDEQRAFNFIQAAGFVVLAPTAPEQSEILLRPLNPMAGGVSHTGGVFFESRDSDSWKMLRDWAVLVQENPLAPTVLTAGEAFFEAQVMPKLLQRGCALEGCHSPDGVSDFRLRSGANGFFAPRALHRNYEGLLTEFMALDTPDVRQSRAVKKNIPVELGGMAHRAGPILVDDVPSDTPCPTPFDPATNTRSFCVFKEWHRLERQAALAAGTVSAMPGTVPLVFVARPPNPDNLLQFDTYRGGADLRLADATVDATGAITAVGNVRSALGPCAGLAGQDADVRGPEWSYDGKSVVFAARVGAASGLDLWLLDVAGGTCRRLTNDNGRLVNDVRLHNFDPVFAPDGSVVFASTRAGSLTLKTFQPNANLNRVGPGLDFGNPEQMTFLLNAELSPAFMQDGRVTFTAEKASADFYQLSGRRINWDLTDYHPLLAQRAVSQDTYTGEEHPSVGYAQATEIREGLDRNFVLIMSDVDAPAGGGTLATFNRSVGPFQADRDEVTFLKSVVYIDQASTYRSPFSLPNGEILASRATGGDPPRFELAIVNEHTGAHRTVASDPSLSYVEAAVGYKRAERLLFRNTVQLVFGGRSDGAGDQAVMHFPDLPVLATLLGANLRNGRNIEPMDKAVALKIYEEHPPSGPNPGNLSGSQNVYVDRTVVGSAKLEKDKSLKVLVPAGKPLILELIDGKGNSVLTMTEEHQVSAGEYITPGPPRKLFNAICGGCHGSILGPEVDVAVSADALTGASVSLSRDPSIPPKTLQ